jgi:hypothetical protein
VKISIETFDQILATFPELADCAQRYALRVGLKAESSFNFHLKQIQQNFSLKASFLKCLCQSSGDLPSIVIEMARMLVIKNAGDVTNAKRWFYFSRFLRIAIAKEDSQTLKVNTAEYFAEIVQKFDIDSPIVIAEIRKLVLCIRDFGLSLESIATKFPHFSPMESKETDEFFGTELPSAIMGILRHLTLYPRSEVIKMLDERRDKLFANFLVARELMTSLNNDPSYITRPENYLTICLVPTSPVFFDARNFCLCLLSHGNVAIEMLRPIIEHLVDVAFSVPHTIEVCGWFHEALASELLFSGPAMARYEANKVQKLQSIFVKQPSISTFTVLSNVFSGAQFADPLGSLFGQLAFLESNFYLVYVMTAKYFSRMTDAHALEFRTQLAKIVGSFPKKSRGMAFQQIPLRRAALGYLLALAETDDPAIPDCPTPEMPRPKAPKRVSARRIEVQSVA